jgi:glutamate carboxypeptidase
MGHDRRRRSVIAFRRACYYAFSMAQLPFLPYLRKRLPQMLETLRELTLLESPSLEKEPMDRCCKFLAEKWLRHGTIPEIVRQKHRGDHLRVVWQPSEGRAKSQLLVLGHYDTVYPTGTLANMPFRLSAGKAYGPGTFDMKAGIVQALFALEAVRELQAPVQKRLVFLWTSDEEIGSESSRKLIEEEAGRSDAVFVLEPSLGPRGLLKTSRKGVGEAELIVHGRASHAGLAPEKGINAVHELAAQIGRLEKWNDLRRGVTINADIVSGGSRANVIADRAHATLDLRAWRQADMRALEKRLHSLKPAHRGAKLEIRGGFDRPPLERKHSAALFARAKALARELGFPLGEAAAGGGSDGNFTAALGIPTLDGLGAVGDGAHATHEHVVINVMPQRAALLAALLSSA